MRTHALRVSGYHESVRTLTVYQADQAFAARQSQILGESMLVNVET